MNTIILVLVCVFEVRQVFMVNIIVIAHAEIANSFITTVEHILSQRVSNLHVLAVKKTEDAESFLQKAKMFIKTIAPDGEVLLLTDLFGATPSNIAHKLIEAGRVELITGLNLSMLIRAISYAKCGLKSCIEKAVNGAKDGVLYISEVNND